MQEAYPDIIDVGECWLHKVHNCFARGMSAFGSDVEAAVVDDCYFFKNSSALNELFKAEQVAFGLPENVFLCHINSRWFTLGPAVERLIEQFLAVKSIVFSDSIGCRAGQLRQRMRRAFSDKTLDKIFAHFSTCFPGFSFTKELPTNGQFHFLDLQLCFGAVHMYWQYAPRSEKGLLPFTSHHSKLIKHAIALSNEKRLNQVLFSPSRYKLLSPSPEIDDGRLSRTAFIWSSGSHPKGAAAMSEYTPAI